MTGRRRVKKAVICVAQLVAALITLHGLLSFLSDVYGLFDPSGKTLYLFSEYTYFCYYSDHVLHLHMQYIAMAIFRSCHLRRVCLRCI